jgi:hypothetical protein
MALNVSLSREARATDRCCSAQIPVQLIRVRNLWVGMGRYMPPSRLCAELSVT